MFTTIMLMELSFMWRLLMKTKVLFVLLMCFLLLGCNVERAPRADSDSSSNFSDEYRVPIDRNVYHIAGKIVGEREELVRQTSPASGSMYSYNGYSSGSFTGPEFSGKSFVRVEIIYSDSELATRGNIVILKVTDTKIFGVVMGDTVSFVCRAQAELVAAVLNNEKPSEEQVTWELDYCRMEVPMVTR